MADYRQPDRPRPAAPKRAVVVSRAPTPEEIEAEAEREKRRLELERAVAKLQLDREEHPRVPDPRTSLLGALLDVLGRLLRSL